MPSRFDLSFWPRYPRKVAKKAALRHYRALTKNDPDMEDTIEIGLNHWTTYWNTVQIDEQYIPYPATWLHQRRFEDAPPRLARPTGSNRRTGEMPPDEMNAVFVAILDLPGGFTLLDLPGGFAQDALEVAIARHWRAGQSTEWIIANIKTVAATAGIAL